MDTSEKLAELYKQEKAITAEIDSIKEQDLLNYIQENRHYTNKCFKSPNAYYKILYILGSDRYKCTVLEVPKYFNPFVSPSNYFNQIEYKYCIKITYNTIRIKNVMFNEIIRQEEVTEEEFRINLESFFEQIESFNFEEVYNGR